MESIVPVFAVIAISAFGAAAIWWLAGLFVYSDYYFGPKPKAGEVWADRGDNNPWRKRTRMWVVDTRNGWVRYSCWPEEDRPEGEWFLNACEAKTFCGLYTRD